MELICIILRAFIIVFTKIHGCRDSFIWLVKTKACVYNEYACIKHCSSFINHTEKDDDQMKDDKIWQIDVKEYT